MTLIRFGWFRWNIYITDPTLQHNSEWVFSHAVPLHRALHILLGGRLK